MSRPMRSFWRILSTDPFVPIMLSLFYVVTVLIALLMHGTPKGPLIAVMSAIPAAGYLALLTERIERYSNSAATLALPEHVRTIQGVQLIALALFVLAPAIIASRFTADVLPALGILAAGVVSGLAMAMYRAILFWLVIAGYVARVLVGPLDRLVESPVTHLVLTVTAGVLLWRWFLLPARVERAARVVVAPLADAGHEVTDESFAETFGTEPEAIQAYEAMSDRLVASATGDLGVGSLRPEAMALGLGYSVAVNVKAIAWGVGLGLAALAAWRRFGSREFGGVAYLTASAWTCMIMFGRIEEMLNAFCRRTTEEGLLRLTPFWPNSRRVKRVILLSLLRLCRGSLAGWAALSMLGWAVGFVPTGKIGVGAVIVGTGFVVSAGAFLTTLARREVRRWRVATILMGLSGVAGSLMVVFGTPESIAFLPMGLGLILLPTALGSTWFWVGRLRFPVNAPDWR